MYEDEYDDGSEGRSTLVRKMALVIGVLALAALGWFVVTSVGGGGGDDKDSGQVTDSKAGENDDAGASTNVGATDGPATSASTASAPSASAPTTVAEATPATAAASPTAPPPPVPNPPAAAAASPTYATNPDGSPAWVIVIFDLSSITLNGAVPDQAAHDALVALAKQYAKPGQAATINDNLTLNPAVPRSVGVRVVELTSARFADGSATVEGDHAAELDRVVAAMSALPNTTALVIGHADQRGDEAANYVLSAQRAQSVVNYMTFVGIDPGRLSSRAVGERDLLDLKDDAAAFALNKRTEFVLFGLLE